MKDNHGGLERRVAAYKTNSERLFAEYLDAQELPATYEPATSGPDFLVDHSPNGVLCEITERRKRSLSSATGDIRREIKRKSAQGRAAKASRQSYVLVIHFADEQNLDLDETLFTEALFGAHTAVFTEDEIGTAPGSVDS